MPSHFEAIGVKINSMEEMEELFSKCLEHVQKLIPNTVSIISGIWETAQSFGDSWTLIMRLD